MDGIWQIATDPDNSGRAKEWYANPPTRELKGINVPGVIQEVFPNYDGVAWYFTTFLLSADKIAGGRYLLQFGAVDYLCEAWLNGAYLGLHEDAEEPFGFDITDSLANHGENLLALRVLSPYEEPVDGIVLAEIPHANKFNRKFTPGCALNFGGVTRPVSLISV
ncbi:MAG: beta galactosidase jelly roll domain-containing protein, partial [Clostridia bacterium]|nr:beta galactosidase jelly roll domain-containing protein [Clostridia bacterium]